MAIVWTQDLEVGVEGIDDQHKELYNKVNQLFEACNSGKGRQFIEEMLNFLGDYTQKHFRDEEKVMQVINYPEYATQKAQHQAFIQELANLKSEFDKSGGNLVIVLRANSMIVDWLNKHISNEDKKIGAYIREHVK